LGPELDLYEASLLSVADDQVVGLVPGGPGHLELVVLLDDLELAQVSVVLSIDDLAHCSEVGDHRRAAGDVLHRGQLHRRFA